MMAKGISRSFAVGAGGPLNVIDDLIIMGVGIQLQKMGVGIAAPTVIGDWVRDGVVAEGAGLVARQPLAQATQVEVVVAASEGVDLSVQTDRTGMYIFHEIIVRI